MLRYLLDTDICIYAIKRRNIHLESQLEQHVERVAISSVTAMELLYGTEKSANPARNLSIIEQFLARLQILNFDQEAARHAATIRAQLEKAGTPIGAYDLMIAGHARSCGLAVVTNNVREFSRVPGLCTENWAV